MVKEFLKTFRRVPVEKLAADELYEAQSALLKAQTGMEFAQSQVAYHEARIKRLQAVVGAAEEETKVVYSYIAGTEKSVPTGLSQLPVLDT